MIALPLPLLVALKRAGVRRLAGLGRGSVSGAEVTARLHVQYDRAIPCCGCTSWWPIGACGNVAGFPCRINNAKAPVCGPQRKLVHRCLGCQAC